MDTILNYEEETLELEEGIHDPSIFKGIILAGGPGSGKSYVAKELGLKSLGMRVVNSDDFFEILLKKKGLSLKMPDDEYGEREAARQAAKALTTKRLDLVVAGRLGVVIDSTSGNISKTTKIIDRLKSIGYDVKVIFIETTLEVAQHRNQNRPRTLPDRVLKFSYDGAQKAKPKLKKAVGARHYHEVENNEGKLNLSGISGKLASWTKQIPAEGLKWIEMIKRGSDSVTTEDINNKHMDSFKEFVEALSMSQRMARGRIARRTAKKRARTTARKKMRMKTPQQLLQKAGMMARNIVAKKMTGGKSLSQLSIPQKVAIGKKLEKKKALLDKLTKKQLKVAKRNERTRIKNLRQKK